MTVPATLEAALCAVLPADLRPRAARLAALLESAADQRLALDALDQRLQGDPTLVPLLAAQRGKHIVLGSTVLAFPAERGGPAVTRATAVFSVGAAVDERQGVFIGEGAVVHGPVIGVNNGTVILRPPTEVPPPPASEPLPPSDHFIGRAEELAVLGARFEQEHCVVIAGMPGVGKTALAARLAARAAPTTHAFWRSLAEHDDLGALVFKLAGFLAHHGQPIP